MGYTRSDFTHKVAKPDYSEAKIVLAMVFKFPIALNSSPPEMMTSPSRSDCPPVANHISVTN